MSLPYLGAYTGLQVDAAIGAIRGENTLIAPLRLGVGTKTAPALSFGSELTSGLYRAAAGDIRLSVLDTDVACFGLISGSAALGIGTAPLVNFHIKRDLAGNFTPWLAENANTTDNNAILMEYRSNTTGVGATSFQQFAWVTLAASIHDHPTRTGTASINYANNGGFVFMQFTGDGILQRTNGNIEIKSNNGNGNVTLTPNGIGRVRLTLDGSSSSPSLVFVNEPTSGLYRAGAGDLRINVLTTDVARFTRANIGSATNAACLMIGPATSTGQLQLSLTSTSSFNHILLNNPDTTNSVESILGFTTTTTGAGAAANTRVAYLSFACTQHDHATRSGWASITWTDSATARFVTWSVTGYSPGATNSIDLGTASLKWRNLWTSGQIVGADGTINNPGVTFSSETTAGFYRAGSADIRFAIASTDILGLTRTTFTGVTNGASLGIGCVPQRPLHIQTSVSGANEISQVFFDNTGTTDGNGTFFNFVGTTTGAGAASQQTFGSCGVNISVHDHATRTAFWKFNLRNSAVSEQFQFFTGGIFKSTTNSLTLQTDLTNGNVVLTANGTGRVNITGGSGRLGVNTIEASTGSAITLDGGVTLPIAAGRFIRFVAGANQRAGDAVLVAGTVTVACTTVSANTRVYLSRKTIGGTPGNMSYTLNAGVGFTINSDNAADTSTISFMLIEVS